MANKNVSIIGREWSNRAKTLQVLTYCDPDEPSVQYITEPCENSPTAERAAVQDHVSLRKAAGVKYAGMPSTPPSLSTVSVTI
jgi:hypothetical protein